MRFATACSGIEACSEAWEPLGWTPVFFAEIEPFPKAVLAHRHPAVPDLGDMTKIDGRAYRGKLDVFCAGTPCQAFSIAGLRQGLHDARGALTLHYVRIVDESAVPISVWENVPGVLSDKTNAFGHLLGGLAGEDEALQPAGKRWPDAGYVLGPQRAVAWRLLDAQYFRLAQRRRRVFVVACTRASGVDPRAILFESESLRRDSPPSREAGQSTTHAVAPSLRASGQGIARAGDKKGQDAVVAVECAPTLQARTRGGGLGTDFDCDGGLVADRGHELPVVAGAVFVVAPTLDASYGRLQGCSGQDLQHGHGHLLPVAAIPLLEVGKRTGKSTDDVRAGIGIGIPGDPMFTLQSGAQHGVAAPIAFYHTNRQPEFGNRVDVSPTIKQDNPPAVAAPIAFSSKDYGGDAESDLAPTLRAGPHHHSHANAGVPPAVATGYRVRRLTPRECERLQGFSDDYTLIPVKKGKRFVEAADGPRYKALGNSMAVSCMRWIGQRIEQAFILS